jgi:hypothetical protein
VAYWSTPAITGQETTRHYQCTIRYAAEGPRPTAAQKTLNDFAKKYLDNESIKALVDPVDEMFPVDRTDAQSKVPQAIKKDFSDTLEWTGIHSKLIIISLFKNILMLTEKFPYLLTYRHIDPTARTQFLSYYVSLQALEFNNDNIVENIRYYTDVLSFLQAEHELPCFKVNRQELVSQTCPLSPFITAKNRQHESEITAIVSAILRLHCPQHFA